jgi:3-phosphoshikimate 1-carboxyvinyltransferase
VTDDPVPRRSDHILARRADPLDGRFTVPASKSLSNRALIASAVAGGGTVVNALDCDDTRLLADALSKAGWSVDWSADHIAVGPRTEARAGRIDLFLGNSGTGARLLLGLLATSPGRFRIDGSDRLRERPMGPLVDALTDLGAIVHARDGHLPVDVDGRVLDGGAISVSPSVSSQFVSSLLLAAPLMRTGLALEVTGELPSAPYLDLTRSAMEAFGADIESSDNRRQWRVGNRRLRATRYVVEGDWSAAAFGLAAAAVAGGTVRVGPLGPDSRQGDRAVCDVLADGGTDIRFDDGGVVASGRRTRRFDADLSDCPDMFPALAAVMAVGVPGSRLVGLDHLRHKESDRLSVMVDNLSRLGARFRGTGSTLEVVETVRADSGGAVRAVSAADDHRIAMAMAVAALAAGPLSIDDPTVVAKSFPDFWSTWRVMLASSDFGDAP